MPIGIRRNVRSLRGASRVKSLFACFSSENEECSFLLTVLFCATLAPSAAKAAETCRFAGTTDYNGHVSVVTTATTNGASTRVDVTLQFDATTPLWLHIRYFVEEVSDWRNGTLQRLDANTRYVFAGHLVRQQWDEFHHTPAGLQAQRIEGKRAPQFSRQFPLFARHWDLASFGLPWMDDYTAAGPVRRPDLDLVPPPKSGPVQSPFALAFYWVRFLHTGAQHASVFLPGFKIDKIADVALTSVQAPTGLTWQADLHHAWLSTTPSSTATAQLSHDRHLLQLSFVLHGSAGSAEGMIKQVKCLGAASQ